MDLDTKSGHSLKRRDRQSIPAFPTRDYAASKLSRVNDMKRHSERTDCASTLSDSS